MPQEHLYNWFTKLVIWADRLNTDSIYIPPVMSMNITEEEV